MKDKIYAVYYWNGMGYEECEVEPLYFASSLQEAKEFAKENPTLSYRQVHSFYYEVWRYSGIHEYSLDKIVNYSNCYLVKD